MNNKVLSIAPIQTCRSSFVKKGGKQYVLEAKPKGQHKYPPPAGTGDSSCVGPEPFRNFQNVLIV